MTWTQKLGAAFAAVLGFLFFLFRREQGKRQEAEAKLQNAAFEKEDAVLKERQEVAHAEVAAVRAEGEQEKAKTVTIEEMEKELRDL